MTPTITLKDNWKDIATKAWSFLLWSASVLCMIFEQALPFLQDWLPVPPHIFGILSGVLGVAGLYARLVVQHSLPKEP